MLPKEIPREIVVSTWQALNGLFSDVLAPSEADIANGKSSPRSIAEIINASPGIRHTHFSDVFASYSGNAHGGRTSIAARKGGAAIELLEAIEFSNDETGDCSAFYFSFLLQRFGAIWHGCYDLDYKFILDFETLVSTLRKYYPSKNLNLIPGLLKSEAGNGVTTLSCIGVFPDGNLSSFLALTTGGVVQSKCSIALHKSGCQFFY